MKSKWKPITASQRRPPARSQTLLLGGRRLGAPAAVALVVAAGRGNQPGPAGRVSGRAGHFPIELFTYSIIRGRDGWPGERGTHPPDADGWIFHPGPTLLSPIPFFLPSGIDNKTATMEDGRQIGNRNDKKMRHSMPMFEIWNERKCARLYPFQ